MENLFIGMLITLFLAIIIAATAILVFKSQQKEDYAIKEDEGMIIDRWGIFKMETEEISKGPKIVIDPAKAFCQRMKFIIRMKKRMKQFKAKKDAMEN